MIPSQKIKLLLPLLLATLVTSVYAKETSSNKIPLPYLNEELWLLQKKMGELKNELSKSSLTLQRELDAKIETLKNNIEKKSNEIKKRIVRSEINHYELEKPHFSPIQHYTFERDIRPILNNKCLACHGCYDAPCQLKMETGSGLVRGASKIKVYDGSRLETQPPTRLGIDYQLTKDWRENGFYPVINGYKGLNKVIAPSLILKMLDLARNNPLPNNETIPEEIELGFSRQNNCPSPSEFDQYAKENPHGGMPLAISGLTDSEYDVLSTWLKEGAKVSPNLPKLDRQQKALVNHWESWLNRKDNRSQLVSRYLYEHLFLAHLYFDDTAAQGVKRKPLFFKLIRSSTPPGQPPLPVKTARPNDVVNASFSYRLQPITDTIVNKTHIIYSFGKKRLSSYQKLFFTPNWRVDKLPGYSEAEKGNPFKTFRAIPAKVRYRFLLNDAAFFVRSFIRGPVCRGQVATNVIRDQFWLMFEAPEHELYTNDKTYQNRVNPLLRIPDQSSSLSEFGTQWINYQENRNLYIDERQRTYNKHFKTGARFSHIWNGDQANKSAFQTIFRHSNSASIIQGWHGALPLTTLLFDFPLFERTVYELVVGFNVFGDISHQAQTRLYFDLIRNEGETNFLRFIPPEMRSTLYAQWYAGSGQIATLINYHELDTQTVSGIKFETETPYRELLERIMARYPGLTQSPDNINRCYNHCSEQKNDVVISQINRSLQLLSAKPARQNTGIQWLPDVSFLRINLPDNRYLAYSLIRNRMHSNVAFMLGESLRLKPSLDTLTVLPTLTGSYPNLLFQVDLAEIGKFAKTLSQVNSDDDFEKIMSRWGVRRMAPDFWEVFHSFGRYMEQHNSLEAGIYDLNRYGRY